MYVKSSSRELGNSLKGAAAIHRASGWAACILTCFLSLTGMCRGLKQGAMQTMTIWLHFLLGHSTYVLCC